jgi:hypothetical protein
VPGLSSQDGKADGGGSVRLNIVWDGGGKK